MMLENENTFLGGLMADAKRILSTMTGIAFLLLFLCLLIAPAMEPLLCKEIYTRANNGSRDEMIAAQRQLKLVRIGLWLACVATWLTAIAIHTNY